MYPVLTSQKNALPKPLMPLGVEHDDRTLSIISGIGLPKPLMPLGVKYARRSLVQRK